MTTPTITGTVAGQTTTSEAPVQPFAGVTIGDTNSGATDTLSITLAGGGTLADGVGFNGLSGGNGSYTLSGAAAAITTELNALVFTPVDGVPNSSVTTTFTLSDESSASATATVDSTTSVIDSDPAVAPTITGTVAGQTTTSEAPVEPFAGVTIGDTNSGAADTLSITLAGGGTLADGVGFNGLSGGNGSYTLSGTAAAITTELDALVFTPVNGVPNTSVTTTFTLSDESSAYATATVNSTTSVIDSDPAGKVVLSSILAGEDTTGTVATFSDANTNDVASAFTATVNWGDGTTEVGTVTGQNGSFAVAVPGSTHSYANAGMDTITVAVTGHTAALRRAI
jgi:hypothetical protein